jgi:hypothetical protein
MEVSIMAAVNLIARLTGDVLRDEFTRIAAVALAVTGREPHAGLSTKAHGLWELRDHEGALLCESDRDGVLSIVGDDGVLDRIRDLRAAGYSHKAITLQLWGINRPAALDEAREAFAMARRQLEAARAALALVSGRDNISDDEPTEAGFEWEGVTRRA